MDANMSSTMHKLSIESKYQVCKDTEANQPSPITKHQGSISSVMKNVNHCTDTSKTHQDRVNEKTTEGILKAARLGDLKMLTELHREGSSISFKDYIRINLWVIRVLHCIPVSNNNDNNL